MLYYFLNILFFILGSIFLYLSNIFSLHYYDIFHLIKEFSSLNYLYLSLSIVFYALFFSLTSLLYIKSSQKEFFLLLPFYALSLIIWIIGGMLLWNLIYLLIFIILIYNLFNRIYNKKFIYKKVPFGELSYQLIKTFFILLSLYFAITLTYTLLHENNYSQYVDSFFNETIGIDFSKGEEYAYNKINERTNAEYFNIINNLNNYLRFYVYSSNISNKEECLDVIEKGFNELTYINSSPQNEEVHDKIEELYFYRNFLIKNYPLIAGMIYYGIFSLYFLFISWICYFFIIIWNQYV